MTEIGNVKVKTLIGSDIWSINKKYLRRVIISCSQSCMRMRISFEYLNSYSGHAYLEHFTALCL